MTPKVILYGAGGHGKVVADILARQGQYRLVGFVDDSRTGDCCGLPVLGGEHELRRCRDGGVEYAICSIGDTEVRERKDELLLSIGFSLAVAIHPSAQIAAGVSIGPGSVVMPGAVIGPDVTVGRSCIVNTGASVDHDCRLDDYVHVAPGARLAGRVCVGSRSLIGMGAVLVQGVRIGARAKVGAGAAVVRDVDSDTTVTGVPARPLAR